MSSTPAQFRVFSATTPGVVVVRKLGHRPALDGVRAIAIVGVMGLHAIDRLFPGGFFGVDIFFVLSAFLITTLILEEVGARRGQFDFRSFYARRALRLGPALLLWLAIVAAPTAVALHESSTILLSSAASILYFGDFAVAAGAHIGSAYTHIWSLAIEEQFYAVWPALLVVVLVRRPRALRSVLEVAIFGTLVVAGVGAYKLSGNYFLPTGHLLPIAVGCLTAHLFVYGAGRLERLVRPVAVGGASTLALVAIICIYHPHGLVLGVGMQAAVAVSAALLILHVSLSEDRVVASGLASPVAVWLGRRSYGLYLYHRTLTVLLPALVPGITLRYAGPAVLAAALALAEVSFRWVERPVSRAGRRWLRANAHSGVREAESDLPVFATQADVAPQVAQ